MLIFLRKQRDETIKLILNLQKKLNTKNKYEIAIKNNNRFVDKINFVKNQANQQRKLFILKKTRSMQLQQRLNVLKISNIKTEEIKRLQRNEIKKSRFFNVFVNTRREIFFFQFSTLINFFLFIILLLLLSAILQTIKKSLTNFFRSTNSSTNLIANSFFSINC